MMRFFFTIVALSFGLSASAQLANGAVAPNFSAPDLNGQSWNLYDILAQGKVVILDISATWCTPCWAYHESHALRDFYLAHGPNGDNTSRVLFVEGDPNTNVPCLSGPLGCNNITRGNWVTGTPYPIIDYAAISSLYANNFYPTVYVICPNKKTYNIGQASTADLWDKAAQCPVHSGTVNAGIYDFDKGNNLTEICETTQLQPSFNLINLGVNPLNTAQFDVRWNGNLVASQTWNGLLNRYDEANIQLAPLNINSAGTMTVELTQTNNLLDDKPADNIKSVNFTNALKSSSNKIVLKIQTDQFGKEVYWEIHNYEGNVVKWGGNEVVGANGGGAYKNTPVPNSPSAYGVNSMVIDTLFLPDGCYSFHIVDAYGDGLCCEVGQGYYSIAKVGASNPLIEGGAYKSYDHRGFEVAGTLAGTQDVEAIANILIFPNPADDVLNIQFKTPPISPIGISLVNALGQTLEKVPPTIYIGSQISSLNVQGLPKGIYWLCLQSGQSNATRKIVIE